MLTQEYLKKVLHYDSCTGIFTWKVGRKGRINCIAGHLNNLGYPCIAINGKKYLSHRLAFLYVLGYFPENCVDHIDRDKSNNRWFNLREVSYQCNARNRSVYPHNTFGLIGIIYNKIHKKFYANIKVKGCSRYLGSFSTILEACYARYAAEQCLDFPECDRLSSAKKYILSKNKPLEKE